MSRASSGYSNLKPCAEMSQKRAFLLGLANPLQFSLDKVYCPIRTIHISYIQLYTTKILASHFAYIEPNPYNTMGMLYNYKVFVPLVILRREVRLLSEIKTPQFLNTTHTINTTVKYKRADKCTDKQTHTHTNIHTNKQTNR